MKTASCKSITLVMPPGRGGALVERLFERGLKMVDLHHARGSFAGGPTKKSGAPVEGEQEIVTCIVESDRADETFALIHELGEVDRPGGGFMYMQSLGKSTAQVLPAEG